MVESVIFDLDGTLIDSAPSIRDAVNAMLEVQGLAPLSLPEVIGFIGNGLPVLVTRVMAARGIAVERHAEILPLVHRYYERYSLEEAHFYPGAEAMLRKLAGRYRLGICTNKPTDLAVAILRFSGVLELFGTVIGGDSLPVNKPDPAPLWAARDALGGAAVFVGDSEVDAETADRAALPFLFFTGGYAKRPVTPLARFNHHDELPGLIARI